MTFKKKNTRGFPHDGFDQDKRPKQPNKKPAYGVAKDPTQFKQSTHPFLSVVKARQLRAAQKANDIKAVTWLLLNGTLGEIARGVEPTLGRQFVKTATSQLIRLQDLEEEYERKLQKKLDEAGNPDEHDADLDEWLGEDEEDEDEY